MAGREITSRELIENCKTEVVGLTKGDGGVRKLRRILADLGWRHGVVLEVSITRDADGDVIMLHLSVPSKVRFAMERSS